MEEVGLTKVRDGCLISRVTVMFEDHFMIVTSCCQDYTSLLTKNEL